jgi:uncharacterized membrane protein
VLHGMLIPVLRQALDVSGHTKKEKPINSWFMEQLGKMITPAISSRVQSIDLLRGLVMIIMALDHVRDYFHADAFIYSPTDLSKTSTVLFFTRWITHFCAPVFVFLAGTSVYLMSQKKSRKELSLFLLKRGVWLIFLDLVVMTFGWIFDIHFHFIFFNVIWMFGMSMIVLAALIHLPLKIILLIGLVIVAGHNLLDNFNVEGNNLSAFLWAILHKQGSFTLTERSFFVGYPLIPWIGVMALGYCLGSLYTANYDPLKRKNILIQAGSLVILLFIILRSTNIYGDSLPWSRQHSPLFSFLSFLNVSKYPPSLLFILMTLGPVLLFLAFTENVNNRINNVVSVYGRVPLFFYVVHVYFIHLLALFAANLLPGYNWSDLILEQPLWFTDELKGYGFSLGIVYLVWIAVVVALYPLCRWYDRYKQQHKEKWWLSYM